MDTRFPIGSFVEHAQFGRGKILGLNEKRGLVRILFTKLGIKVIEYPSADLKDSVSAERQDSKESVELIFCDAVNKEPGCRWYVCYSTGTLQPLVLDIQTWANSKVKLNGAHVTLRPVEKRRMELYITGNGRDGRCRWCRTFRSGLRTAVRRRYGLKAFASNGSCRFHQSP